MSARSDERVVTVAPAVTDRSSSPDAPARVEHAESATTKRRLASLYDWNGVIMGPDLKWRNGRFFSDRSANRDPDFRNRNAVSDEDFDALVRNVYKVLLTRGMIGTVIYSTDAETRDALRALLGCP